MQFCDLPGFYRKTGFLRSYPLSLGRKKEKEGDFRVVVIIVQC